MSVAMEYKVDKSGWLDGPWMREPDRVQWRHAGLDCLAVRVKSHGSLCGYVGVPPGHPAHGLDYDQGNDCLPDGVHGGLTYANECRGTVCHVPEPGEPDGLWWLGFDTAHSGDLLPASMESRMRAYHCERHDEYRDLAYVKAETNRLAEQLATLNQRNGRQREV